MSKKCPRCKRLKLMLKESQVARHRFENLYDTAAQELGQNATEIARLKAELNPPFSHRADCPAPALGVTCLNCEQARFEAWYAENAGLTAALLPFALYMKARDAICDESPPDEIISALPDGTAISVAHFREAAEQARPDRDVLLGHLAAGGQGEGESKPAPLAEGRDRAFQTMDEAEDRQRKFTADEAEKGER